MKKILVVVTNTPSFPHSKRATGAWLAEVVHFTEVMSAEGYQFDYVSPLGGYSPIDPDSLQTENSIDWKWYNDVNFRNAIGATLRPSEVNPADYDAIYYAGGYGVMFDFPQSTALQDITRSIYEAGGYVTAVCHGSSGLINVKMENGESILQGRTVTGYSKAEDEYEGILSSLPFSTEEEIKKVGGLYTKAEKKFQEFAVADGRIVTGQNPASGGKVAELLRDIMKK